MNKNEMERPDIIPNSWSEYGCWTCYMT